ncbi:phosphate acetyltransferase [Candidatus Woesearchaeota archaeon]|nr:phosphate acetyltransferase [Candidatus Woesearchaeota archaeon]
MAMKRIVVVEADEPRMKQAINIVRQQKIAEVIILGAEPGAGNQLDRAIEMLQQGKADGVVAGVSYPSAAVIRASFKVKKGLVSSFFVMRKGKRNMLFADCAVNIHPGAEQLAEIGMQAAASARQLGLDPVVAFLSFSTKGSAQHEEVSRVRKAAELAQAALDVPVDGELQLDAAINPEVCRVKCPECRVQGRANVLIFPELQSANIGYKLVKELAGFQAIGPILQGLQKPVNDLSRGADVEEIVEVIRMTAMQAEGK